MSEAAGSAPKPLVVAVCAIPLLQEAISAAMADIAQVQGFPAHRGDTVGLLRSLNPDAVVVDAQDEADAAASFAYESNAPLVYISLKERKLRILRNGDWQEAGSEGTSPEEIRNVLVAGLFARGEKR
jgi:hypothetical protein